jgi:hypothetical protein
MKPVVYYGETLSTLVVGQEALILDVSGHPATDRVSNTPDVAVRTSQVLKVDENGVDFETLNTQYKLRSYQGGE